MYNLFKPILFLFDPEKIHRLTLLSLKLFPFRKKKIYTNLKNEVFDWTIVPKHRRHWTNFIF